LDKVVLQEVFNLSTTALDRKAKGVKDWERRMMREVGQVVIFLLRRARNPDPFLSLVMQLYNKVSGATAVDSVEETLFVMAKVTDSVSEIPWLSLRE
jgi:GTP1/Obg family GTP-binding protein